MGYYTRYELTYSPENAVLQEYLEHTDFSYGVPWTQLNYEEIKWYEHDQEMAALSKLFPTTVFCLHGSGEEPGDLWGTYYQDGKMQKCPAHIVYDPFDPAKLKDVQ